MSIGSSMDEVYRVVFKEAGTSEIERAGTTLQRLRMNVNGLMLDYNKGVVSSDAYKAALARNATQVEATEARTEALTEATRRLGAAQDSVGSKVERAGGRMGKAGLDTAALGRSVLATGRAAQDFAQGGLAAIINNIEDMSLNISKVLNLTPALVSGIAGGLTAIGTVGFIAYKYWDEIVGLFQTRFKVPDLGTDSVEGLGRAVKEVTKDIEEMRKKTLLTADQLKELNTLEARRKELQAEEKSAAAEKARREGPTPEEAARAAAVAEADKAVPYEPNREKALQAFRARQGQREPTQAEAEAALKREREERANRLSAATGVDVRPAPITAADIGEYQIKHPKLVFLDTQGGKHDTPEKAYRASREALEKGKAEAFEFFKGLPQGGIKPGEALAARLQELDPETVKQMKAFNEQLKDIQDRDAQAIEQHNKTAEEIRDQINKYTTEHAKEFANIMGPAAMAEMAKNMLKAPLDRQRPEVLLRDIEARVRAQVEATVKDEPTTDVDERIVIVRKTMETIIESYQQKFREALLKGNQDERTAFLTIEQDAKDDVDKVAKTLKQPADKLKREADKAKKAGDKELDKIIKAMGQPLADVPVMTQGDATTQRSLDYIVAQLIKAGHGAQEAATKAEALRARAIELLNERIKAQKLRMPVGMQDILGFGAMFGPAGFVPGFGGAGGGGAGGGAGGFGGLGFGGGIMAQPGMMMMPPGGIPFAGGIRGGRAQRNGAGAARGAQQQAVARMRGGPLAVPLPMGGNMGFDAVMGPLQNNMMMQQQMMNGVGQFAMTVQQMERMQNQMFMQWRNMMNRMILRNKAIPQNRLPFNPG